MPDSFQLELPDPDPDEEPLELEVPAGSEQLQSATDRYPIFDKQRGRHFLAADNPQAETGDDPFADGHTTAEPQLFPRDPDLLWQENVDQADKDAMRFSLSELFFVTALLAVILTVGRFMRLPLLAGILGLLVLIGLGFISNQERSRWAYVVWVTLITAYVFIAIGAAWTVKN